MSQADIQYNAIIKDILENGKWDKGTMAKWSDGTPAHAKSVLNKQMKFDNGKEIPILTSKRVPLKDPIIELFWIWQKKSNVVQELRDMGCTVWDEWELPDGTVGKSYGWQLRSKFRKVKPNDTLLQMIDNGELSDNVKQNAEGFYLLDQVDYLLYMLKANPYSRRIKTTLWCVEDLDDMALPPCVYETHWQLWDDKLHLTVSIRSNDMGLGNPYNVYQYSILHRLIAQVTGHKVGTICFNIDNAHVYDRHIEALKEQIQKPIHDAPEVQINPNVKSFYDFTLDDIKVINYKHSGAIRLEVAIS
jgi:thymidylate synthase